MLNFLQEGELITETFFQADDIADTDHWLRIPADPDGDSGSIRTLNRKHPDTKPETSGHFVE
ncbi:hypothetical protein [Paenibacillus sp. GP183]|uniref:hypothetical protein n=1 Tax=Paenibacillus sp. GP183 TaxID=1882751 RepID=UPI000B80C6C8|nr:hypothetical protein [Paenibacillus sp. GP183]